MNTDEINGKTPEEIKKALGLCPRFGCRSFDGCPYEYECSCTDNLMIDALALIKRLEAENGSLKANMEHEAARSIQMVNEIADMTIDLDINALLERAGMQPYTHDTLSKTFVLRLALKKVLDERDAAINCLQDESNCAGCKWDSEYNDPESPCLFCKRGWEDETEDYYTWRGPEPTKEEDNGDK